LNANPFEPDGITSTSKQGMWLQHALADSHATWKLVYFHQPPFSTAKHDPPEPQMDWPFREWGATAVFMGHEHAYERIIHDGIPYFIDGLGGHPWVYQITDADGCKPVAGSAARYNGAFGALIGVADSESINFCFYSLAKPEGACIDAQTIVKTDKEKKSQ
jgi:tartrate-resistant acid phosphatase type 5